MNMNLHHDIVNSSQLKLKEALTRDLGEQNLINNGTLIRLAKHLSDKVNKEKSSEEKLNKELLIECDVDASEGDKFDVDLEELQRLLTAGADINTTNRNGRTCLMEAVKREHYAMTKLLLENGAATDIEDKNGVSALFMASTKNYEEIEKLLLDHGATPFDGDRKQLMLNKKLLTVCSEDSNLDKLQKLLIAGADINTKDEVYNATCLMFTAGYGRYEATKLLIDQKSNVNHKMNIGMTALYMASEKGYIDVVRLLLESGANTEIKDVNGMTALYVASENGHFDVVRLLIKSGANIEIKDRNGDTPLKVALSFGYNKIGNLLLEHGATPLDDNEKKKVKDMINYQFLSICSLDGYIDCYSSTLSLKERIKASGPNECNDFNVDLEKIQRLLTVGADINITNSDGKTCLIQTIDMDEPNMHEMTKILLENGAATDLKDNDGNSALYLASKYESKRYEEIKKLLLDHGATPLEGASSQGR